MTLPSSLPPSRVPDPREAPPLRWGVLAPGWIATAMVGSLQRHTDQRVVAVGSRSAERAGAFASRFGVDRVHASYEALVADPEVDAVYVASPHSEHREHALMAIAAGKHVLVEKAFTRNAAEAREVVDAARAAGVTLVEAMWTRFLPRTDVVRQLLADGALGDLETVSADHGQFFPDNPVSRLFDPALAGGALLDLGIYPVSYASFVLGAPGRVTAVGEKAFTGVDRQVAMVLDGYGERPVQAVLHTTMKGRTPTVAVITGSEARIELPGDFYTPGVVRLVGEHGVVAEAEVAPIRGHEGLCYEAAHLAGLVAEGRVESPLLGWDETISIMETLDEVRRQVGVRYPGE